MTGEVLGIDVGGSSVKAGLVDLKAGRLTGELISAPTPRPSTPPAVTDVLAELAARLPATPGRVGVAFPSVIKDGTAYTAANIDAAWLGTNGAALASRALARPVLFLNDADAAGLAEMRFGSGRGCTGTVIMLTFGTGIGSALFTGGRLFPNSELGHLELRGMDAEKWASAQVRTAEGLGFPAWIERVNEYLLAMHKLFWPDVFILGGAVSERFAEFAPLLRSAAQLRAAHFAGQAGVVGAALAAAEA
ncbi:MAG: ROK family protein [Gammaproteobacteria bacterium]|nr:MAG: ROK family protein [Gammaproteobacteria bacterium]